MNYSPSSEIMNDLIELTARWQGGSGSHSDDLLEEVKALALLHGADEAVIDTKAAEVAKEYAEAKAKYDKENWNPATGRWDLKK